ncbi:MAG TPA: polymorphic toxin-type HINT domain-containing protein, partial [Polyangia bacterium]
MQNRSLLSNVRGSVVDKIIVIAVFVFAIVGGVRFLSQSANQTLDCQGQLVLNPQSGVSTCRPAGGSTTAPSPGGNSTDLPGAPDPPKKTCDGPYCMCFVAGTLVMTADGHQPIETLTPGTLVLAREENGLAVDHKPVARVYVSRSRSLVRLTSRTTDGRIQETRTTGNHPFFTDTRGWLEAHTLVPGRDRLVDWEGRLVEVLAVESLDQQVPVYNLEVADFHTYFVGETGLWVHNRSPAALILARPNPVGRVVPIRIPVPGAPPLQVDATVIAANPGRTFQVRRTDETGQVHLMTVDWRGRVTLPDVGTRITVNDIFSGTTYDGLVVRRDPGSVEVEGIDGNIRRSGTYFRDGTYISQDPPRATPYLGGPIADLPVRRIGESVHIGNNIEILPARPPDGGWPGGVAPPGAATFADDALNDLQTIAQTESGRRLLNAIETQGGAGAQPVYLRYRQVTPELGAQAVVRALDPNDAFFNVDAGRPGRGRGANV